jgi:hypothetical protein
VAAAEAENPAFPGLKSFLTVEASDQTLKAAAAERHLLGD